MASAVVFNSVKLVKGGTISGNEKATGAVTTTDAYYTFGGAADLWGVTLTDTDVNASTFGVVVSLKATGYATINATSRYLKATNFSFSIPSGATINGITVEVEANKFGAIVDARIDHIRITVDYTAAAGSTVKQLAALGVG